MSINPRRAREIARTREDILDAAARAITRSGGVTNATMQDIAREAGYTAASLYSYFPSKEEIVRSLFQRVRSEIEATKALPYPAGLTFRQKLELLLRRHLVVAEKFRPTIQLFHLGGEPAPELCPASMRGLTRVEVLAQDFEAFFAEHAGPGDLGRMELRSAAMAFAGLAHVYFVHWLRDDEGSLIDGIPRLLDLFFHGVQGPPA